jgi:hypothetical protein
MKKFLGLFLSVLFASGSLVSAQSNEPFAELDRYVKTEQNGFFSGEESTVTLFNAERIRLGKNFETELLKYLGKDIEKHYWISAYLDYEEFLQGNERLPQLSLRIKQRGLSLIETQKEEDTFSSVIGLNVTAAILSQKLKLPAQAKSYKAKAENLMKKDDAYRGTFPALDDADRAIYDAIEH